MSPSRLPALIAGALLALAASPAAAQTSDAPDKLTFDPSGWLVLNSYASHGNLSSVDLPRNATPGDNEHAFGMGVRQSRLRAALGIPTDGLIGTARLKGFVEIDFMGGNAANGADDSLPVLRLRHAYVASTWKDLANLTVLAGQTWGLLGGPWFADSLSHLAVPRFAGAGMLYRRAPQLRVSGDAGRAVSFNYAVAVMAPLDRNNANYGSTLPLVGYRSATPNFEGRVGAAYRPVKNQGLDVGFSAHYGREKYALNGLTGTPDEYVNSRAVALDAKLELPYVTLKGAAFAGENLDVYYSWADGVAQSKVTNNNVSQLTGVQAIATRGFWSQAVVTPISQLSLLVGMGIEQPRSAFATGVKNRQISGGAIVNLSSRWRTSLEYTSYATRTTTGKYDSGQVELSGLLAF